MSHETHKTYFFDIDKRWCVDCQVNYIGEEANRDNEKDYINSKLNLSDKLLYESRLKKRNEKELHATHRTEFSTMFHRRCIDCNEIFEDYEGNAKDFAAGKFNILGVYGDGRENHPNVIEGLKQMANNIQFPFEK